MRGGCIEKWYYNLMLQKIFWTIFKIELNTILPVGEKPL